MNEKLKPNFTQIPNVFFDEIYSKLGFAELKVLLYIMRRTYGFQKKTDKISLTQFENGIDKLDTGTGLARKNIISALSSLEEKKIVIKNKNKYITSYSLYLDSDLKLVTQSNQTSYAELPELVTQSNPQKKEKESIQNKDTAFDSFWSVYPKKVNKKVCENLWKTKKLNSKLEVILNFVKEAKNTERWQLGYIKAPDVFLRNENWEDDLEAYKPIKATLKKDDPLNY